MSGREPLPIGAHGKVTTTQLGPRLFEAITRVKDPDGQLRRVRRQGRSRTAAENALKAALLARSPSAGSEITGSSTVAEAGEKWLATVAARVQAGDRAHRTLATYRSAWEVHVLPGLGAVRLREATTGRCEAWLTELRRHVGASMCSTARAVLSGVLGYAARMDAIPTNPVRDLSPIPGAGQRTRKPRAMTAQELGRWLEWMDTRAAHPPRPVGAKPPPNRSPAAEAELAAGRALGDITRMMLATGVRIGEVMAISWEEVDFDAGTVEIAWHLVRAKGQGLVRMEGAKSEAGHRVLRLPEWGLEMLRRRRADPAAGYPVFPDELGGWRDPNLVMRWLRWSRAAAGFEWVTSHVWRQTVITVLDRGGLSTREVADQAGHSRVSQTQEYMERKVASDKAAVVLEAEFGAVMGRSVR